MSLDYENAKASYLEAVDIEPKQASAYLALADIYMLEEDPEEAAAILEQGLAHVGEDSDEAASIQPSRKRSSIIPGWSCLNLKPMPYFT